MWVLIRQLVWVVPMLVLAALLPLLALDFSLLIASSPCHGCKPQPQVVSRR